MQATLPTAKNNKKKHIMKNIILIIIITTSILSCKKTHDLFTFDVKDSSSFTIEAKYGVDLPFSIPTPDVTTSSETEFKNNNTKASLVKEIILKKLTLTITSPSGQTFKFLKNITLYISADGEKEIELAKKENIDNNVGTSIDLDPTSAFLDVYVKKDKYKLRTQVTTDEVLLHDVDVKVDLTFQVTAKGA